MSRSAAEILALAGKAARGAGAPPAQAARFGEVAAVHLMAGRSAAALRAALDALPEGPVLDYPLAIDAGLVQADAGQAAVLTGLERTDLLQSYIEALPCVAALEETEAGVLCLRAEPHRPRAARPSRRITLAEEVVEEMTRLAALTFVPESEQSRSSGAGAGLTDND